MAFNFWTLKQKCLDLLQIKRKGFKGLSGDFEEMLILERLYNVLHEQLHHIDLLSSLYDPKSGSSG